MCRFSLATSFSFMLSFGSSHAFFPGSFFVIDVPGDIRQ
jgi:hypothetical protein